MDDGAKKVRCTVQSETSTTWCEVSSGEMPLRLNRRSHSRFSGCHYLSRETWGNIRFLPFGVVRVNETCLGFGWCLMPAYPVPNLSVPCNACLSVHLALAIAPCPYFARRSVFTSHHPSALSQLAGAWRCIKAAPRASASRCSLPSMCGPLWDVFWWTALLPRQHNNSTICASCPS